MARTPNKYKVPKSSWTILFVLILAGVGAATVGGELMKRFGHAVTEAPKAMTPAPEPEKPPSYQPLAADDAVLVTLDVVPKAARLMLDGDPLPSNPVRLPRGKTYTVSALADGYKATATEFVADKPKTVRLRMTRQR